jgi:ATP synthase protein I
MSGETDKPGSSDADLKARLDKLSGAIKTGTADIAADRASASSSASSQATGSAMGMGFRVASELMAGVIVGGGMGWALDRWLGTQPLFLIVMLLVGMVAGFWNVYRLAVRPTGGSRGPGAEK